MVQATQTLLEAIKQQDPMEPAVGTPQRLLDVIKSMRPEPEPTILGGAAEAGRAVARGAGGIAADLLRFPGTVLEFGRAVRRSAGVGAAEPSGVERGLESLAAVLRETLPERRPEYAGGVRGFFAQDVPEAFGTSLAFMASAWLTGGATGLGTGASVALPGMAAAFSSGYEQVAEREDVPEEKKWVYALLVGGMGASEAVPLGRMLARINKRSGGALRKVLKDVVTESFEEGGQEGAQKLWEDFWRVQLTPDEYGTLREELGELFHSVAVGAVSGGLVSGAASTLAQTLEKIAPEAAETEAPPGQPPGPEAGPAPATPEQPPTPEGPTQAPGLPPGTVLGQATTQENLAAYVRQNVEQGLPEEVAAQAQVVQPRNEFEQGLVDRGAEFGATVALVDAGQPLPAPGGHFDGLIFLDTRSTPREQQQAVLFHELVHRLARLRGLTFRQVYQAIHQVDRDGLRMAQLEYLRQLRRNRPQATLPRAARREEGLATYVQVLGNYVDLAVRDPQRLVRLGNRNLLEWLMDAVTAMSNRLFGTSYRDSVQKRRDALHKELAKTPLARKVRPEVAAKSALLIAEGWQTLRDSERRLEPISQEQMAEAVQAAQGGRPEQIAAQLEAMGMSPEEAAQRAAEARMRGVPVGGAVAPAPAATPAPPGEVAPGPEPGIAQPPGAEEGKEPGGPAPPQQARAEGVWAPEDAAILERAQRLAEIWLPHSELELRTLGYLLDPKRGPMRDIRVFESYIGPVEPDPRKRDERVELAVVGAARGLVQAGREEGLEDRRIFELLLTLYRRQPLLRERTSTSRELQQFSTPVPIAFLADKLAGPGPAGLAGQLVYDPTAGHGALLIDAPNFAANEIDRGRAQRFTQLWGVRPSQNDATKWVPDRLFDVIIANPPFGRRSSPSRGSEHASWVMWGPLKDVMPVSGREFEIPTSTTTQIDQAIAVKALSVMRDDGRAVLILGSKKGMGKAAEEQRQNLYRTGESKLFFRGLYSQYNVVDHFTVPGELYFRQGAAWPIDIIVIEGRGQSALPEPREKAPRVLESWEEIRDAFFPTGAVVAPGGGPGAGRGAGARGAAPEPGGVRPGPGAEAPGPGREGGEPGGAARPGGRAGGPEPGLPAGRPPGGVGPAPGTAVPGPGRGGERPAGPEVAGAPEGEPGGPGGREAGAPEPVAGPGPAGVPDLDALIEGEIEKATAPAEKPAPKPPAQTRQPAPRPRPPTPPPTTPEGGDWADGLIGALALETPGTEFDEQKYQEQIKPLLSRGAAELGADRTSVQDMVTKLVAFLRDRMQKAGLALEVIREKLRSLAAYIKRFVQDETAPPKEEETAEEKKVELPEEPEEFLTPEQQAAADMGRQQVPYAPASMMAEAETLLPVGLASGINQSLARLADAVGDVDLYVANKLGLPLEFIRSGALFAEQVDAIALAIFNHELGKAMVVGDQTGIGKGRIVAAMIMYAQRQGYVPIFITERPTLYKDMYRDLKGVRGDGIRAWITDVNMPTLHFDEAMAAWPKGKLKASPKEKYQRELEHIIKTGTLPKGFDAIFTTYSQLNYVGDPKRGGARKTDRHRMMESIASRSFLILDESHNAGGTNDLRPKRDAKNGDMIPPRALFMRQYLAAAKGAMFSSATFAKNPATMTLYFLTDIGRVAGSPDDLREAMMDGGVPMQQVVSTMLGGSGQYIRRERDFDGIAFRPAPAEVDVETMDSTTGLARSIQRFDLEMENVRKRMAKALKAQAAAGWGQDTAIGKVGVDRTGFTSVFHNLIAALLLASKVPAAIDHAERLVKERSEEFPNGRAVVLTSYRTFGEFIAQYMEAEDLSVGSDATGLTFNRMFLRYLKRTREFRIKTGRRATQKVYIDDEMLANLGFPHLVAQFKAIQEKIEATDLSYLSVSPIDAMIEGLEKRGIRVGEITGRQVTIRAGKFDTRTKGPAQADRTIKAFNQGELDALLINSAGSTGISLHASVDNPPAGQKPRHMMIMEPAPDIFTLMQTFGRVHRTGQVVLPEYSLLTTPIPAERRVQAVVEKRMSGLNANVTSERAGAMTVTEVVDFLNEFGDQVAFEILSEDPAMVHTLGLRKEMHQAAEGEGRSNLASRLTARAYLLSLKEQEALFDHLQSEYLAYVNTMTALGLNTLEAQAIDLDAVYEKSTLLAPAVEGLIGSMGEPAMLVLADVKRTSLPLEPDDILKKVKEADTRKLNDDAVSYAREKRDELNAQIEELQGELDKITIPEGLDDAEKGKRLEQQADLQALISDALTDKDQLTAQLTNLQTLLRMLRPGKPVRMLLRAPGAERTDDPQADHREVVYGYVTDIRSKKQILNPLALSNYQVVTYTTHSNAALPIPFSKIHSGAVEIQEVMDDFVRDAFETIGKTARQKRFLVVGNLLSGFIAAGNRGQIVRFTQRDGPPRMGVLMPLSFNPKVLADAPVRGTAEQAGEFMTTRETQAHRALRTTDGVARVVYTTRGQERTWAFLVSNRKGQPYYLNRSVRDLIGDFTQRAGQSFWTATTENPGKVREVLRIWQEEAGATWAYDPKDDVHHAPFLMDFWRKIIGLEAAPEGQLALALPVNEPTLEEVRRLQRQALEEGEGTGIGSRPNVIAGTTDDPEERALQRAVREVRADAQIVQKRKWNRSEAEYRLYADWDAEKQALIEKIRRGEALNAVETEMASIIKTEAGLRAIATGDRAAWVEATRLNWAYQDARRESARSLGQIRDPIFDERRTGREKLVDLISIPSIDIRRKIIRIRKKLENPDVSVGEREAADRQIDKLLHQDAARGNRARQNLIKAGFDPEAVTTFHFDDPITFSRIARIIASAKSGKWDWYVEYMLAAMLSGPLTQKANLVGNTAHMLWEQWAKRLAEAAVNTIVRDPESATWGEVYHFLRAVIPAAQQAAHYFMLAYQTQLPAFELDLARRGVAGAGAGTKLETRFEGLITEQGVRAPLLPGMLGTVLRFPSLTTLLAFDEAAKAFVGVLEAHALAYREARREGVRGEAIYERMQELLEDVGSPIHERAIIKARKVTFQERTGRFSKLAMQLRGALNELIPGGFPLGTQLLPFIATPVGIFKAGLGSAFAPALLGWRTLTGQYFREGKTVFVRDSAHALLSTLVLGAILNLLFWRDDDDLPAITGSTDPIWTRAQFQYRTVPPYMIRVFGQYWDYRRIEPASVTIATLVDIATAVQKAMRSRDQDAVAAAMQQLLTSVGDQAKDKTFLRTLGDFYEAVFNRERNERLVPRLVKDQVFTKFVPNLIRQPLREADPYLRASQIRKYEDKGAWEAGMSAVSYEVLPLSGRAPPPKYDTWGRPITRFDPAVNPANRLMAEVAIPVRSREVVEKVHDLDRLILNYNRRVEAGDFGPEADAYYARPPDYWYTLAGKTYYFDDQEYARLGKEAGELAASRLLRSRLNMREPGLADIDKIKETLAESRRAVRMRILRERRRGDGGS